MRIDDQYVGIAQAFVNSRYAFARTVSVPTHHNRAGKFLEVPFDSGYLAR